MTLTPIQTDCLALLEVLPTVELTTHGVDGYPATRAMLNLRCGGSFPALAELHRSEAHPLTVYFTTNTGSAKVREIAGNDKAAVYLQDAAAFCGYLLQGRVEVIVDEALKTRIWQPGWEVYYPKGREDYTVLKFTPVRVKTYRNFTVTEEEIG